MRFNLRLKIGSFTLFGMLAKTQRIEGATSLQKDGTHTPFWDMENCTLAQAEQKLRDVQNKFGLSHIYIVSDKEGSYRAWCFSKVSFQMFLAILTDCLDIIDYSFYYYTVKRHKATLRTNSKKDRPPQKVVSFLPSYPAPIPNRMQKAVYDTGLVKRGYTLLLGEKGEGDY